MELPLKNCIEDDLWERLSNKNDISARTSLIERYMPYAKILAATLFANRPDDAVDFVDYEQLAHVGLIHAVDKFDYEKGVAFKTFASYRIKGSILNGLEKTTEKRNLYARNKRANENRLSSLTDVKNIDDTENEFGLLVETTIGLAIGCILDELDDFNSTNAQAPSDPYECSEYLSLKNHFSEIIDRLPDNEKKLIQYHYYHQIDFTDIAVIFDLSKGRVSQIHKSAINTIRKIFDSRFNIDKSY